jgi:hypothetical protein
MNEFERGSNDTIEVKAFPVGKEKLIRYFYDTAVDPTDEVVDTFVTVTNGEETYLECS